MSHFVKVTYNLDRYLLFSYFLFKNLILISKATESTLPGTTKVVNKSSCYNRYLRFSNNVCVVVATYVLILTYSRLICVLSSFVDSVVIFTLDKLER